MKKLISVMMVFVLFTTCCLSVHADNVQSRSLTSFWNKLKFAWGCDDATSLICADCGEDISFEQLQLARCPHCNAELTTKNGAIKYGGFGGGSSRGGGAGRDGAPAVNSDGKCVVYATPSFGSDFSSSLTSYSSISGNTFFFDFPGGSSDFTLVPCNHKYKYYTSYSSVTRGLDWTVDSVPVDGTYYPVFEFSILSGRWSPSSYLPFSGNVFGSGLSGISGFPLKVDRNYILSDYSYINGVYNSDVKVYYPVSATIRLYFLYSADKDLGVVDDSNVDTASKVVNINTSTSITYNTAYNYGDTYIIYDSNNHPSVLVRDDDGTIIGVSTWDDESECYILELYNNFDLGIGDSGSGDSGSDGSGGSSGDSDSGSGGSGNWLLEQIVEAIKGLFGVVGTLIGGIFLGLLTLVNNVLSSITSLTSLLERVSDGFVAIFSFLPEEYRIPLGSAFTIFLFISVFKMLRK